MKLELQPSNQFRRDVKLAKKRGFDLNLLTAVIQKLANGEELEPKYRDHPLTGNFGEYRECHIQPDWHSQYSPKFPVSG